MLGSALGILPGGGASLASFGAYALEKRISKNRDQFGKGAIEGVAAPESGKQRGRPNLFHSDVDARNSVEPGHGSYDWRNDHPGHSAGPIGDDGAAGTVLGHHRVHVGGQPILLVLNLPLIGLWVKLISVPYHLLYPMILVFCAIGVFSLNNSDFDVYLMVLFGFLGYVFRKLDCEPAPMLLGFILGPMMEEFLRRALLLSRGDP